MNSLNLLFMRVILGSFFCACRWLRGFLTKAPLSKNLAILFLSKKRMQKSFFAAALYGDPLAICRLNG